MQSLNPADTRPRIAKVTLMHDGLLVEVGSGLVIFYRDAVAYINTVCRWTGLAPADVPFPPLPKAA